MKKSLICISLIMLAIASYTIADDFKDWIIAKHQNGVHAVGIGSFQESPMILLSSKDGKHKVAIGLQVTDEKSEVYLIHQADKKEQTKILSSIPLIEPTAVKNNHPLGTSQNPTLIVWNKTPKEQGIEIGDWITIRGYVHDFVAAGLTTRDGRTFIDYSPFHENVMSNGRFMKIYSEPKGKIESSDTKLGFVSNRIYVPHMNPVIRDINLLVYGEKWESVYVETTSRVTDITHQHGKWNIGTDPSRQTENSGIRLLE